MESYYSSDEEIAWGPVTLREIKGDLKRPVLRKPNRRHTTVYGSSHTEKEHITADLHTENMPHLHDEVENRLNISGTSTAYYTPNDSLRTDSNVNFLERVEKVINEPQSDLSVYASALDNTKSSVFCNTNSSAFDNTCLNFVNAAAQRKTQYDIANFHQTLVNNSLVSEDDKNVGENQYSDYDSSIDEINLTDKKRTSKIQEEEEEDVILISDGDESLLFMDDSLDEDCTKSCKTERKSLKSEYDLAHSLISSDSENDEATGRDEDNLENSVSSEQRPYRYKNISNVYIQAGISRASDNIDHAVEEERLIPRLIVTEHNEVPIYSPCTTKKCEQEDPNFEGSLVNNCLLIGDRGCRENSRVLSPIKEKYSLSTSPIEVPEFDLAQFDSNDDSLKLDDTMEAMNRLLEHGASYISDEDNKEIIEPSPTKQCNIISDSCSQKLQPINLPSDKEPLSKTPLRDIYPTSAEKAGLNRDTRKMTSPAQFRVPEMRHRSKFTKPTPPKTCHNNLKNVVSPVALYINNSPRVTLKKNIPQKEFSHVVRVNSLKVASKENHCNFPEVVYKPSKTQVTHTEKAITLPPSLKKLNVKEPIIIKHEGRIKQHTSQSVNRKLLESDITNNSIDASMSNNCSDISILSKKQAYIK